MSTYGHALYQLVFTTKYRGKTLQKSHREALYKFIWGLLKEKKCYLYRIGGVEDHIHIIVDLHPSVAVAGLIKDIKLGATAYIKEQQLFPHFAGWQKGYAYFTYANEARRNLINYVKNQEEHHHKQEYKEELVGVLAVQGVEFDERFLD